MKKLSFILLTAVLVLTSCHKDILADLDSLHTNIDSLETRVTALEQQCQQINKDITALQTIVTAIQQNDMITALSGNEKDGYTITFLSGKTITILNGKDGADGYTPVISIQQDADGNYYWTLDGAFLLDDNGNKIPVTGIDGTNGNTPQLEIRADGYWYLSYDNGTTWTQVGQATGDKGTKGDTGKAGADAVSMFSAVTYTDTAVTFTLANGTVLIVPFATTTDTYTLIYNPNDGNGTNDTVTVWNQQVVTISACTFTREGYKCIEWNTQPDGTGVTYKVGSSIVLASNLTLYAQWRDVRFSIAADKKVLFSPGNLQYQASTNTWRFAEHQYDYCGDDNSNISSTYSGWIDLFGWGTGNNPTQCSKDTIDYATFTDWGTNPIGDYPANIWRTMTRVESSYVFQNRTNAKNLYGSATVNGTKGLVLLPDAWTMPNGIAFKVGKYNYKDNVLTAAQWLLMEEAGAIFMPAAGLRDGTDLDSQQFLCSFWTSTEYNIQCRALYYIFTEGDFTWGNKHRYCGLSVRLVREL